MSQSTATARVASRAQRRTTTAQPLHVVPARAGHPGSGLFAALCMLLLVGGLMGLLMLNTSMAEGSFALHRLQATSGELTDTEEALTAAIDAQRAPSNLAARAARLGMVPADSAAFLRLSDGAVLGVAKPAEKGAGFTVVTAPQEDPAKGIGSSKAKADGPRTSMMRKGDVTTTTVVVTKPDGTVVTTTTSVNARTRTTTSTTKTTGSTAGQAHRGATPSTRPSTTGNRPAARPGQPATPTQ